MSTYLIFDNDENRFTYGAYDSSTDAGEEADRLTREGGRNASFSVYLLVEGEGPPI